MTGKIAETEAQKLLRLARTTIGARITKLPVDSEIPPEPLFSQKAATFVTLKIHGQLRGCIGTLEPSASLWESIRQNAENAAFHDSRFMPLTKDELDQVHIDISILTKPEFLEYLDGDDLVRKLRPGIDGVILRHGRAAATFLPQVWSQLPTAELFLGHLCRKAGLPESCWREDHPQIETYQVQCFAEEEK